MNQIKLGGRTLKTGLAITIAVGICHLFGIEPAIFAAVSAVVNLQPTVYQSYINALQQIGITFTGIIIGLILAMTLGNSAVAMGISSILIIIIALRLRWNSVILIGIVTVIFIIDTQNDYFYEHAFSRISVIFIGLIVALFVNVFLAPPDHRKSIVDNIMKFHDDVTGILYHKITNILQRMDPDEAQNHNILELQKQIDPLRDSLNLFKQEIRVLPYSTQANEFHVSSQCLEDLQQFNTQLLHKIILLSDMEQERTKRIATRKKLPYSNEFQRVIDRIQNANEQIFRNSGLIHRQVLQQKLEGNWEKVSVFDDSLELQLEAWHNEHAGDPFYMQALMEISILLYEIRLIAREQYRLFKSLANE
ncbi:hypothetical protein BHU72_03190 [Desulfuribacillus stibiiarsenatis]|uniref:Uncharacterized protein n=1 Tax=Desulfuribacillus stibiiarsenatis TaxID=1390249 RepID=A0A1E5L6L8_9FIRM|nr:aromatic acid exporter family protein [Desulfuribacillus stibiiarsenatis]OEH85800.1 hypothetical protein BHU72_03190 [Desulfuribacillus stibiiarsenatis]